MAGASIRPGERGLGAPCRSRNETNRNRNTDMSFGALLKGLGKALPVILANAPAVIAAVKEVKKAVKKEKKKAEPIQTPATGG